MRLLLVLALVGCDPIEDVPCEPGESLGVTSHDHGALEYTSADTFRASLATAVGGTQRYEIEVRVCHDDLTSAVLAPREVTVDPLWNVRRLGPTTFELDGIAEGRGEVRALTESGRTVAVELEARTIVDVRAVTRELGDPDALLVGTGDASLLLLSAEGQPVVDRTLAINGLVRGERWNQLDLTGVGVGDHAFTVHAGGQDFPRVLTVIDTIDEVVSDAAHIEVPSYLSAIACFHALRGGKRVGGVPWEISITGQGSTGSRPNCASVYGPPNAIVTARAFALEATTTVTFAN